MEGKRKHLTLADRIQIERGLDSNKNFTEIGKEIGKDPTTVLKEVRKHIRAKIRYMPVPWSAACTANADRSALCSRRHVCGICKSFTSKIAQERQATGTNDIAEVAAQTPPDSAANILRRFRQEGIAKILHDQQNLGDIRRVNLEKVALEPGGEYIRFLTEWYNSMA